jgi:hypothetical protein
VQVRLLESDGRDEVEVDDGPSPPQDEVAS